MKITQFLYEVRNDSHLCCSLTFLDKVYDSTVNDHPPPPPPPQKQKHIHQKNKTNGLQSCSEQNIASTEFSHYKDQSVLLFWWIHWVLHAIFSWMLNTIWKTWPLDKLKMRHFSKQDTRVFHTHSCQTITVLIKQFIWKQHKNCCCCCC